MTFPFPRWTGRDAHGRTAVVFGTESGKPLSVAHETVERVECIGLAPWTVRQTLDHIGGYWLGDFGEHGQSSPASSVRFSFGLEL